MVSRSRVTCQKDGRQTDIHEIFRGKLTGASNIHKLGSLLDEFRTIPPLAAKKEITSTESLFTFCLGLSKLNLHKNEFLAADSTKIFFETEHQIS